MADWQLVVVPHTHWDREWYRTHASFRYRLVRMLDGLLELLERDPGFRHFTLDGQTIVVDDYLEVRPEARPRIEALVRAGRLLVGPWFVLPDEWLVSGEALIRNLRRGLAAAEALGGAMPVGYVPDQFGHVGQLPQIFQGFGLEGAALWRGVGEDIETTLFAWDAPDGSSLPTLWLPHGYGNGMHLPSDGASLAARLEGELRAQAPRSLGRCVLVMNGSDHLSPQPELPAALAAAAAHLSGARAEIGTLPGYLARALAEAPAELPRHAGELRSGLRAPLLAGCASSRIAQKQQDFRNDRLLTRYLEPLAAWHALLGGDPDLGALDAVWRTALENHPHDSICGCSIDAVHDEMETRFRRVADFAGAQLARVQAGLARAIAAAPGEGHAAAVWNPHGGGRAVAEGCLELPVETGDGVLPPRLAAPDAGGRALPVHAEVEAPGIVFGRYELPAAAAAGLLKSFPSEFFGEPVCALTRARDGGRDAFDVWLGETPPADFDWERERASALAELARASDATVVFRPRRLPKLRVSIPGEFPGAGLRTLRLRDAGPDAGAEASVRAACTDAGAWLENDAWRVEVDRAGSVRLRHRATGLVAEDALRVVSEADRGDTYSFDPLPDAPRIERPETVALSLAPASGARAAIELDALYRVPEALAPDRRSRSRTRVALPVRITLALFSGSDRLDVAVALDQTARDHRLRLQLRAPFAAQRFAVESAFERAERPIAPPPDFFGAGRPAEWPDGATPQRRYALLESERHACVLANRGSSEVEAVPETGGTSLALTLVRAVGWLSQGDLARRPAHAGPPLETPGAQCLGRQRAELALWLGARRDATELAAQALRFADPPLAFSAGSRGATRLRDGDRLIACDDPAVELCALEPRPGGATWIRLLNASPEARSVQVLWNGPGALVRTDLRGRALAPEAPASARATIGFRPWQLVALAAVPAR
jgi:hypothetical protein